MSSENEMYYIDISESQLKRIKELFGQETKIKADFENQLYEIIKANDFHRVE